LAGEELKDDVEDVRSTIQKYFIVNDIRYDSEAFAYFVQLNPRTLEEDFDNLRRELLDLDYVPMLLRERSGFIVYVTRKPVREYRSIVVNVAFLIATIFTTVFAGMMFVSSYWEIDIWSMEAVGLGALFFAAPLMFILGIHEMGHYIMARRHRVAASLPFFLPAPPILGTFGAFISLREPIHSKRALIDIGIAGPIAGFVAAIFITILGLRLSALDPQPVADDVAGSLILGTPLIFQLISTLVPTPDDILIHPTAFAGWVGFLVTFLNLLPAGQLDGGHIMRAMLGDKARWAGYITVGAMFFISATFNYFGWIVFIIFILFVFQHPPPLNDVSPLPPSRWIMGAGAILILLICFVPVPIEPFPVNPDLDLHMLDQDLNTGINESVNATLVLINNGNGRFPVHLKLLEDHGWNVSWDEGIKWKDKRDDFQEMQLPKDPKTNFTTYVNFTVTPGPNANQGDRKSFEVIVAYENEAERDVTHFPKFTVTVGWIEVEETPGRSDLTVGILQDYEVKFKNLVHPHPNASTDFNLSFALLDGIDHAITFANITALTVEELYEVESIESLSLGDNETAALRVWLYAPPGTEEREGQLVELTVSLADEPNVTSSLDFTLDVYGPPVITIEPLYPTVSFVKNTEKEVFYRVVSDGHMDVRARFTFNFSNEWDDVNWTIVENADEERTIEAGSNQTWSLKIYATGEVGTETDLVITVSHEPEWELIESPPIRLRVTLTA
jgi:membrane-associated protease RseP (regulator of RpoE activity)